MQFTVCAVVIPSENCLKRSTFLLYQVNNIYENILYARKNLTLYSKHCEKHNYNTRIKNKIVQPQFRLVKVSKSFMGNCIRFYNKIPEDIQNLTDREFKNKVKQVLCSKGYYRVDDYLNDKDCWCEVTPTQQG